MFKCVTTKLADGSVMVALPKAAAELVGLRPGTPATLTPAPCGSLRIHAGDPGDDEDLKTVHEISHEFLSVVRSLPMS